MTGINNTGMKTKIQVLHIDDNKLDRQLVIDSLVKNSETFEVTEVDNRENFEQLLEKNDFDVILSDFNILGFNGLQVLEIAREKCPDTPVIIVTGTGSEEIAIRAIKMGASDYVIKSANHIRGLAHTIEMVLENKKARTERKNALAALRKSEEKFRKIFENTQDVFYQLDKGGNVTEISPSIFHLSGYQREEMIGMPVQTFYYDPKDRDLFLNTLMIHGEVWDYEMRLKTKAGELKYASLNAHIMINEKEEVIGTEGSLRDITERKQMEMDLIRAKEKAEESDQLKTAFLHNISHEIRTPLNAIVGFAGLLSSPELSSPEREQYADIILRSSDQLLSIMSDILSISAIEAGQEKITESQLDLKSTLDTLYQQFLIKAERQHISLNLKPGEIEIEDNIVTDGIKLMQILANLIDNAIKFTSRGHVTFGYQKKDNELIFYVEDTGIGVAVEMREKIFKRFHQVESTSTRQFGGSGLGLSISKAFVELLGGRIWLESELNKGSTFYFTIPLKMSGKNTVSRKQILNGSGIRSKKSSTILIAEDEDTGFTLLERMLSGEKITILRAKNGVEAVAMCKSKQIDLVLMDIKMPVMDGMEATRQIRKFLPGLPIIAQTAYSTEADKEKTIACGCNEFISKPIKKDLLMAKINAQLRKARA
jgi:PAS domain S-box-containing protein